jgi:Putative beta-lactamase-inhibitor-like, PepSY-like
MNAKISIYTIIACFTLLVASCSKDDENIPGGIEPPKFITDAFQVKYPGAVDTEWQVVNDYYVADFQLDSAEVDAWFAPTTGQLVMEESSLRVTRIPEEIITAIQESVYASWSIDEASVINRTGFGLLYRVEVKMGNMDTDLYMSQYGDLIKVKDNAQDNTDMPILIPAQVASLMELTFSGSELLYMEADSQGYILYMLDKTAFKIAQLNSNYMWQSTTWKISAQEVPAAVMQAFLASSYGGDSVSTIYTLLNAEGTFFLFNVIQNGQAVTAKFDAAGKLVTK